jgi:hypothetical protein
LLRWSTQRGVAVIPKSNNQSRLAQNLDVCSFDLKEDEIEKISALDKGLRFNNPTNVSVLFAIYCSEKGDIWLTFDDFSTVSTFPSLLRAATTTYKIRQKYKFMRLRPDLVSYDSALRKGCVCSDKCTYYTWKFPDMLCAEKVRVTCGLFKEQRQSI